ncbi:hypothetical protein [Streptomyces nigrescens]|uniref:hypothetical protein n=1 Tax=Streptomyces nigrescens TaxID=1920 RepID=UPI0036F4EE3A
MTHPNDPETPDSAPARNKRKGAPVPQTAAEWREALRKEELPPEFAVLSLRQRRRARKQWRSARRDERAEWIKNERKKTPTPVTVPIIALALAGAVAGAAWLLPSSDTDAHNATSKPTPAVSPHASEDPQASTGPSPSSSAPSVPDTPDAVAKAFVTAYTTREPLKDGSHTASVDRAARYASTPLVKNLKKHDDRDFNQLVAAQATQARPTKVTISEPEGKQRPAVDTSIRAYRSADVSIAVQGTDNYTYTRHLTIEVARADAASPWMVTRVLGVKE